MCYGGHIKHFTGVRIEVLSEKYFFVPFFGGGGLFETMVILVVKGKQVLFAVLGVATAFAMIFGLIHALSLKYYKNLK